MPERLNHRILVIDDSPSIHDDFRKVLVGSASEKRPLHELAGAVFGASSIPATALRFEVDFALQGQQGLELVKQSLSDGRPYAVAFVDMRMPPGWDGLETIRHLWDVDPKLQVVICTAFSDHSWASITEKLGHTDSLLVLKKPFDHVEAMQLANALAKKWTVTRDMEQHLLELDRLVDQRTLELRAAKIRFSEAFNASPLPQVVLAHKPFEVLEVNQAFRRQFGLSQEDLRSINPENFGRGVDPDRFNRLLAALERGESIDDHSWVFRPPGRSAMTLRCSARASDIDGRSCSIWLINDITRQLSIEEQLRQAQKMEAVGQLAAGIAHDFNNLLTVILGYTSELLRGTSDPFVQEMVDPVRKAADQAASLTRQLLIFSRKDVLQRRWIRMSEIMDNLCPMLQRLIAGSIQMEWELPEDSPHIYADPASIEQLIVNLVVNARDAMPDGGTVRIVARVCQIDEVAASRQIGAKPGPHMELSVSDTGSGIHPDILPHIFEPFFTTKEVGKGTGLGLSMVFSIARQHEGWIQVESEPGHGATFLFYLPLQAGQRQARPEVKPQQESEPELLPKGRFLVAEDDPTLRALLDLVFRQRKLSFDLVSDGVQALQVWEQGGGSHCMLVTDVAMPNGVSGIKVAQELRKAAPDLPVLLMTGYSAALSGGQNPEIPGRPVKVVMKPVTPKDLFEGMAEAVELARQGQA